MEEKKLRAVIYCRFSTAEQIDSSAMNAQTPACMSRSGAETSILSEHYLLQRRSIHLFAYR